MLIIKNKERFREILHTPEGGRGLAEQIAYLAGYGTDDCEVTLFPSWRDPYCDVTFKFPEGRTIYGGLVYHTLSASWSVHT